MAPAANRRHGAGVDEQPTVLTSTTKKNYVPLQAERRQVEASGTSHLDSPAGPWELIAPADDQVVDTLALEATFNRNSIPICQRPYGSTIFMRVLEGDIYGVYDILVRCEGSLWDHDPYGLGILYVGHSWAPEAIPLIKS